MKQYIVIFFAFTLFACSTEPPSLIENLHIDNGRYIYAKNTIFTGKAFTYFPNTTIPIQSIDCSFDTQKQICIQEGWSLEKTLLSRGLTHDGIKEGLWKIYNNNILVEEIRYSNGKKEETGYYYSINGILERTISYKEDIPHGTYTEYYSVATSQDTINNTSEQEYSEVKIDGSSQFPMLKEQGLYAYGKKEGKWVSYYPDGIPSHEILYSNDKKHGVYTSYHTNGTIKEKGTYNNDVKEGAWFAYHDNGQLQTQQLFINGIKDGIEVNYHSNSKVQDKVMYNNGLVRGTVNSYDENGRLEKTTFYDVVM